jgi:septum formation inhibitor MinC
MNEELDKAMEELKKKLAEEEKSLKAKYAAKMEIIKKRKQRVENIEAQKKRKQENHLKFLIGGYILAQIKNTKKTEILTKILEETTRKTDKELIENFMNSLTAPEAGKPSSTVSPSSKLPPKMEAPQKS